MLERSHFFRLVKCKSRDKRLEKLRSNITNMWEHKSFLRKKKVAMTAFFCEKTRNIHRICYERTKKCSVGRHDVAFHFLSCESFPHMITSKNTEFLFRKLYSSKHKVCAVFWNVAVKPSTTGLACWSKSSKQSAQPLKLSIKSQFTLGIRETYA